MGVLVVVLLLTFFSLMHKNINKALPIEHPELFTVISGESLNGISAKLRDKGWLENRFWIRAYVRLNPQYTQLKAGTYQINANASALELLQLFISGKEHQFSVTFIEGTTIKEWLALLAKQPKVKHTLDYDNIKQAITALTKKLNIDGQNPEGWFFPDTYAYTDNTSDITILSRAHQVMKKHLDNLWQSRAEPLPYQTPYQALIMASIVEKESAQLSEKPVIASVFVNRLYKKMRLQTDPTVIYGLGDRYQGDITRKHLREKTAYNTYRINGLPPTPIAMPGLAALEAVMQPASTDYFYFVSQGNGHHVFSKTLVEHNRAVAKYQLKRKS